MNRSKLSEHKLKKGKLIAPLNFHLPNISLSSWVNDRLPHYLWLGLILDHFQREEGLNKIEEFLYRISPLAPSIEMPSLLHILNSEEDIQNSIYEEYVRFFGKNYLYPLTAVFGNNKFPHFARQFYNHRISVMDRANLIEDAIRKYSPHQSNEATDLRYLTMAFLKQRKKIVFTENCTTSIAAFEKYAVTPHSSDEMRSYRPSIRSMEGVGLMRLDPELAQAFWDGISQLTECRLYAINREPEKRNMKKELEYVENYLSHALSLSPKEIVNSVKFEVLCGILSYSVNAFREIIEGNLDNKILGRVGVRVIAESYAISKYLILNQTIHSNIWQDYKMDGIGKYKLILLKLRESTDLRPKHMDPEILEIYSNEETWEEYINTDLGYFDNQSIRDKFIQAGEKSLFDTSYDYDSSFAHGLWGAIRESSMVACDNSAHRFHRVPEFKATQSLKSVLPECFYILSKHINLAAEELNLPKFENSENA